MRAARGSKYRNRKRYGKGIEDGGMTGGMSGGASVVVARQKLYLDRMESLMAIVLLSM